MEYQYSVSQCDGSKKARHSCVGQERIQGIILNIAVPDDVRGGEEEMEQVEK